MFSTLLPPDTVVVTADHPRVWEEGLLPAEAALLGPSVALKRRREFTAGRNCARRALVALGLPESPLLSGAQREPLWPSGVVGSITHSGGYCAAAVGRATRYAGIGIDCERHLPVSEGVVRLVCTARERAWLANAPDHDIQWPTLIFSAKESFYKVWFPLTGRWLGFEAATLTIDPARSTFQIELDRPLRAAFGDHATPVAGRYAVTDEYLFTSIVLPAAP